MSDKNTEFKYLFETKVNVNKYGGHTILSSQCSDIYELIIKLTNCIKHYFFSDYKIIDKNECSHTCNCNGVGIHVDIMNIISGDKIELLLDIKNLKIKILFCYNDLLLNIILKECDILKDFYDYEDRIKNKNIHQLRSYINYRNLPINPNKYFFTKSLINKVMKLEKIRIYNKYKKLIKFLPNDHND